MTGPVFSDSPPKRWASASVSYESLLGLYAGTTGTTGPQTVADWLGLGLVDVSEALAYYHRNPKEMTAVEERPERVVKESTTLEKPG